MGGLLMATLLLISPWNSFPVSIFRDQYHSGKHESCHQHRVHTRMSFDDSTRLPCIRKTITQDHALLNDIVNEAKPQSINHACCMMCTPYR